MKIETKRHPTKFYLTLGLGSLFFIAIGSVLIFVGIDNKIKDDTKSNHFILAVFGSIFCLLAIWMVYKYLKNAPKVIINKSFLRIGNEKFRLDNIKDVILTGKMPFPFIINFPMEGSAIVFKDGREIFLFDDMYANSYEVKSFLEQVVVNKQEFKLRILNKIKKNVLRFEKKQVFKGNQFITLRGISLWWILGLFILVLINRRLTNAGIIFFSVFGPLWFILHSWLMHYFVITKNFLVIRNHNFTWKERIYSISDIREVVFESRGNQPNCLKVITIDFKSKLYPASTLSDRTWLDMKKKLETKGIEVRNECIYEE